VYFDMQVRAKTIERPYQARQHPLLKTFHIDLDHVWREALVSQQIVAGHDFHIACLRHVRPQLGTDIVDSLLLDRHCPLGSAQCALVEPRVDHQIESLAQSDPIRRIPNVQLLKPLSEQVRIVLVGDGVSHSIPYAGHISRW
jgi:hypothetical protein